VNRELLLLIVVILTLLAACGPQAAPTPAPDAFDSPVGLPNPASVYCEEQGYELVIRNEEGGQVGYCVFPDGSECEEWAFYRGECGQEWVE
jgi:putative hemolysin